MSDRDTFFIKELAAEFGLTLRTLRFYEERGLIRPTRLGSMRIYSREDRDRLKLIARFATLGFPLTEVKQIVDLHEMPGDRPECWVALKSRLVSQRQILREQSQELERMMRLMEKTLTELDGKLAAQRCPDLTESD
ncbi:MerR family transcriptional regulator [Jiella sp. MQZ9-1]|uniref:MerR family transcriptional regulator n=1 Tax=Jiella flava TaxID=2816857 RepID=A0A939FXV6_9HYPH|nr:MerR family transcriptional regulator [Jiella flava]MBO0663510.1 MerR family transcriptional regulator [Jiella flava]MCD2472085.1 MerR family transcriptional regulator [Jiella flava]